ncbi:MULTISPECIES: helix-turn-helix domain-containing protein [Arthrobacter]|nr:MULTISPECIES: helix-turn-helix domain-containing protein [Arthrobacter]MBT8163734.1 helix-turn-helix domain-containing protein [Arthrobacter sp. GN70]
MPVVEMDLEVRGYGGRYRRGDSLTGAEALRAAKEPWQVMSATRVGAAITIRTWYCDRLMVSRCRGNAASLYRRRKHLGDAFDQYIHMVLVHTGAVTVRQGGREAIAGPRDIVTLLPRSIFEGHNLDGTDATLLQIPIVFLEYRGIDTDQLEAAAWSGGLMVDALRDLVNGGLALAEGEGAHQAPYMEQAVLELATGLLSAYFIGYSRNDDLSRSNRDRVLELVEDGFADPAFDIDHLATALGASRRYVYRLFEGRKVSVASIIKSRRLDEAEMLLRTLPEETALNRIARVSGFASSTSLNRAFKERNGITPTQYRSNYSTDR